MEAADFWNDPEVSQKKMKELKSMKDDVATYASLTTQFEDIETLIEMGYEENDATLIPEIEEMLTELRRRTMPSAQRRFCPASTMGTMPLCRFMRARAVRSPVTGQQCFTACIHVGR